MLTDGLALRGPGASAGSVMTKWSLGPLFTKRTPSYWYCSMGIPIINLRRSSDRLRSIMGIPVPVRQHLFTPQPSRLEGYCHHGPGGRLGGRLPNLRNPYLCNRLTDFLHSKFCGIVWACRCALSWSYAHLPHMGLPMGKKLVKFGTNWVQTLRNAYLWNCWMDLPHLKFHGLV